MAAPRKQYILFFQPMVDSAIICGEPDVDDPPISDTQVKIFNTLTGDEVADETIGSGRTNVRITGLSLSEGVSYRARMRHENADGWGSWSPNAIAVVPADLPFTPLEGVAVEPQPAAVCPFAPQYALPIEQARAMSHWDLETGHIKRRPRNSSQRTALQLVFGPMSQADRNTLRDFLQERIEAVPVESFTLPTAGCPVEVLGLSFWPRGGSMQMSLKNNAWQVQIDVDEVRTT